MGAPLYKRDPMRTRDIFPDTQMHGDVVLAFDERHKDFVEVSPSTVRSKPRIFQFWLECRRKNDADHKTERRVKNVKSRS